MWAKSCRNFLSTAGALAVITGLFAGAAYANHHHELNGVWQLIPARSELHGEPAIESGTVSINDREGNITVERNFTLDSAKQTTSTSFVTDARHGSSIKEPGFKSKSKWEGDVLKVTTDHEGMTTVERYSLVGDGTMVLQVDRTGRPSETFYFERH
jgi:hypothetical protein